MHVHTDNSLFTITICFGNTLKNISSKAEISFLSGIWGGDDDNTGASNVHVIIRL